MLTSASLLCCALVRNKLSNQLNSGGNLIICNCASFLLLFLLISTNYTLDLVPASFADHFTCCCFSNCCVKLRFFIFSFFLYFLTKKKANLAKEIFCVRFLLAKNTNAPFLLNNCSSPSSSSFYSCLCRKIKNFKFKKKGRFLCSVWPFAFRLLFLFVSVFQESWSLLELRFERISHGQLVCSPIEPTRCKQKQ